VAGELTEEPQDAAMATHAPKLARADGLIDWSESAEAIWRRVRAFHPWPLATTMYRGELFTVHQAWPVALDTGAPPGTVVAGDGNELAAELAGRRARALVACGSGALALLEEMETEAGITPDHVALTCLVDACLKAGEVEDAGRLAARLETTSAVVGGVKGGKGKGGGRPQEDEKSFGVRVMTLLEQGQWEAAWRSIQEAETAAGHVPVPSMSYSVLLNAAAKEGRGQDAVEMLLHMREKRGLEPSTVDLSSAINACRLGGEVGVALKLLEVLKLRRQEKATAKSQGRKGGKGGKGRGKKEEDLEEKEGLQQAAVVEEEEEEEQDSNPYQVSYGLVLDLLAKQLSSSSSSAPPSSSSVL
jgi:pentatricopeptide repeat protein